MIFDEGRHCLTCDAYMGGGACRVNLEAECREGGGFEAWRPRVRFVFPDVAERYVREIGHDGGFTIRRVMGHYELELEGWPRDD